MHEDDPADLVHDVFSSCGPRRHAAGSSDARHRDEHRGAVPRPTSPATTGAATRRPTWWSRSSGTLDHDEVLLAVTKAWDAAPRDCRAEAAPTPLRAGGPPPASRSGVSGWPGGPPSRPTCSRHAGLSRHDERRFRPRRAVQRARWGHEQPAVPGDPREARARLLRLLVHRALRRHRPVRRLRGLPPKRAARGARHLPRAARPVATRRHHRRGARARQGPARRRARCSDWKTPARA